MPYIRDSFTCEQPRSGSAASFERCARPGWLLARSRLTSARPHTPQEEACTLADLKRCVRSTAGALHSRNLVQRHASRVARTLQGLTAAWDQDDTPPRGCTAGSRPCSGPCGRPGCAWAGRCRASAACLCSTSGARTPSTLRRSRAACHLCCSPRVRCCPSAASGDQTAAASAVRHPAGASPVPAQTC